jgi:hypothetical protein
MPLETKSNVYPSARPSHVAIGAQCNDHSAFLAGVPAKQFFTDASTFARVQLLITEYYQLDVLSNFWDVYNIEAEALGQKIIYPPSGIPDVDRTRPLISTPADLDRLSPPDPYRSGRMPWIRQFSRIFLEETGSVERVYFTATFSAAVNIRGYENLVLDIYDRPRFVHRLLAFLCDEVISPFLERIKMYIDKMARGGRCMLHLNQIPADTPPEHIHTAVAACHTYGKHPIPDNLQSPSEEELSSLPFFELL